MKTQTEAVVLKVFPIKEKDRIAVVFTKKFGIIRCFVRGTGMGKLTKASAVHQLSYVDLSVFKGKNGYTIDEAETLGSFFNLNDDLELLTLAEYLCELTIRLLPEEVVHQEALSLLLNSLYMLANRSRPPEQIKAVFELRLLTICEEMPNVYYCQKCGAYDAESMYFVYGEKGFVCCRCYDGTAEAVRLGKAAYTAVRYAVFQDAKKLFSFSVKNEALAQLAECAEGYVMTCCRAELNTLDFYHTLKALDAQKL